MADDLVFTLRFNTKIAEGEVSRFSSRLRTDLQKAFASVKGFTPDVNLSRALGLKTAIDEMKMLDSQMKNLQKSLRTFSAADLRNLQLETKMNQYRTGPKGGLINPATGERIRGGRREALRMAANDVGIDNDSEELRQIAEALAVKEAEEARINGLKDLTGALKIRAKQERTEANRLKGIEALRRKEMNERLQQIRTEKNREKGQTALQRELSLQGLESIVGSGFNQRTTRQARVRQAAMDFAAARKQGKVSPGETFRNFMPGGQRATATKAPNALGISPTATGLLALSSILAPLNSQLGMVAMQAGFAAFSLGAPAAALSVLASAAAGFAATLKKAVTASKEAGLETRKWSIATTKLAVQMNQFWNVLGVKTQLAFAPVVDEVTKLSEELGKLPWDDVIDGVAEFTKTLAELASFAAYYQGLSFGMLDKIQKQAGLQGSQKFSIGKVLGAGAVSNQFGFEAFAREIIEMFQAPKNESVDFIHTPKFNFSEFQNLGMDIQKSILKQEEKSPEQRAIEEGNRLLKNQLDSTEKVAENTATLVENSTKLVPILGF